MDRQTVYPAQILPETTLLQMAKDSMVGLAKLSSALLGTSTIASGFSTAPTSPASLQVVVAPGEIYALAAIDGTAWSSLAADTTHSIMKQGISLDSVTLNCAAPGTNGQSINYLVEAAYQELDSTPVLLPYYNSANPSQPYSGMGNNGLTQNTVRKGAVIVQIKAGASATTGSQLTPAPDSGYVGLFVVTVANAQTTITSANISQYSGAPLLQGGLLPALQNGSTTGANDIGTAGAYAANFTPAITTLTDKMLLCIKALNPNAGASTFTPAPGVIAAAPIVGSAHSALQGGEIVANGDVWLQWNSSIGSGSWVLIDSTGGALQVGAATKSQHAVQLGQANNLFGGNTTFVSAAGSTALTSANAGLVSIDATAGAITITLPVASSGGTSFQFARTDATANAVTISRAGSDLIGGATSLTLSGQYSAVNLRSNGVSAWTFFSGAQRGIARYTAAGAWVCPAGITQIYASGVAGGGGGAGGGSGIPGAGGGAGQSDLRRAVS